MTFEEMVEYRNTHSPHLERLGVLVEEIRLGYGRTGKTIGPEDANPFGTAHGGVAFSMADSACASAAASYDQGGFTTVNCTFNFLRSGKIGDKLTAEARAVKKGKTIGVFEAEVKNQEGKLIATGTFTFYFMG